jgi:hypothetical protein
MRTIIKDEPVDASCPADAVTATLCLVLADVRGW